MSGVSIVSRRRASTQPDAAAEEGGAQDEGGLGTDDAVDEVQVAGAEFGAVRGDRGGGLFQVVGEFVQEDEFP